MGWMRITDGVLVNQIGAKRYIIFGFTASYKSEIPKFLPVTRAQYRAGKKIKRITITGIWRIKRLKVRNAKIN